MNRWGWWLPLLLLGCSSPAGPSTGKAGPAGPVEIQVGLAEGTAWVPRLEVSASLAPWETVTVAAEGAGKLTRLRVELGDKVRRGQVLGEISPEEVAWQADKAQADAVLAEASLKRLEALVAQSSATPQELDKARADAIKARAEANLAAKRKQDALLKAPFDGWIAQKLVAQGDYLTVGKPVVQVTAAHPLRLRAEVPEMYGAQVQVGTPVEVYPVGQTTPILAKVSRTSPLVSASSRTFLAEADVDNPDARWKAGSFARARFSLAEPRQVATVPEQAVISVIGANRVYQVEGEVAKAVSVTVLGELGDKLQVEGIPVGSRLAVTNLSRLYEGAKVKIGAGDAARSPVGALENGASRPREVKP